MARLSGYNSGHERTEVLFGAGSGECRLQCMLMVLELLLSVDYLLLQLQKQSLTKTTQKTPLVEFQYISEGSFGCK